MDKEVLNIDKNSRDKLSLIKLLSGKSLKIIILSIICIITIILFLGLGNNSEISSTAGAVNKKYEYITTMEYCTELENKLEDVLSQIKGAGSVGVMISVEGSPELIYAVDSDTKVSTNSNGSTTTSSSSPIIVQTSGGSTPLILTENLPLVNGVIVVSSGASDIGIKLDIINAVSTLLDISTDKISVLKGI